MTEQKLEANVEGIPPRGDLIKDTYAFLKDNMDPKVIVIEDPLTGTKGAFIVTRDADGGDATPIPESAWDAYAIEPRRRKGTATLTSINALIAHVNRFKDEGSALFAKDDRSAPSITAVLDYHPANIETPEGTAMAKRFGQHRSHFAFPLSDEWKAWNSFNGKRMSVADFAEFLEDRIADITEPGEFPLSEAQEAFIQRLGGKDRIATVSDLVTLSKGLRIHENSQFSQAVDLASGQGEVVARSEHTDVNGVPLLIPTTFQIAIPVFRNDGLYVVVARLRYRPHGGALTLWYELWGLEKVFDHAFTMAADKVASETKLPLFLGSPEMGA